MKKVFLVLCLLVTVSFAFRGFDFSRIRDAIRDARRTDAAEEIVDRFCEDKQNDDPLCFNREDDNTDGTTDGGDGGSNNNGKRQLGATCSVGDSCPIGNECDSDFAFCCNGTCVAMNFENDDLELDSACMLSPDCDESSCAPDDDQFGGDIRCTGDTMTETVGTCAYELPTSCDCTDDNECDEVCLSGVCDYYRYPGETCTSNEQCYGTNTCSGTCSGIAQDDPCEILNEGEECSQGFVCVSSNPLDDGITAGTCQPILATDSACSFLDFVSGQCGYGSFCDVDARTEAEIVTNCFNITSSEFVNCGTCQVLFSGEVGASCNTNWACKPYLHCNLGTNQCEADVEDTLCLGAFPWVCSGSQECACNSGTPRCQVSEDNNFFGVETTTDACFDAAQNFIAECPHDNECALGAFEDGTCIFENCELAAVRYVCGCGSDDEVPCGVDCDAETFTRPDACCTGNTCDRTDGTTCTCYSDACAILSDGPTPTPTSTPTGSASSLSHFL